MRDFVMILLAALLLTVCPGTSKAQDQTVEPQVVSIRGSMGALYGLLHMPDLAPGEKCPMVIFCHGFRGNLDSFLWQPIIANLNAQGIGALRFDFNGCGKSEGEFKDMTVPNEIEDLMSVISYTRALPTTASISLVGKSQGGVVCGMAAGTCGKEQIKALVLLAAAASLRDDTLRGNTMGLQYDPWHLDKPFYTLPSGENIGRAYLQTNIDLPIYEQTSKYTGPALVINGIADTIVPFTYAQRYAEVLRDSQLILIPGENHAFSVAPDYTVKLVSDWLAEKLIWKRQCECLLPSNN